jgi:hypothetical protein
VQRDLIPALKSKYLTMIKLTVFFTGVLCFFHIGFVQKAILVEQYWFEIVISISDCNSN